MNSASGIPLLGFGTWPLKDDDVERCVRMALEAGFRHIDTARMYGNEKHVGRALKASGVARRDLYVVTKVDPGDVDAKNFRAAAEKSVEDLGGPVDLLLIHWPPPDALIRRAAACSSVKLINNQVEFHPLVDQSKVLAEAQRLGMTLSAYCPLGRGIVLKEPVILDIAKKHGRPPSEIGLRWIVQQGVAAIPMTTKRDNAVSNFRARSFSRPEEDMRAISALTARHQRVVAPASMAGRWDN